MGRNRGVVMARSSIARIVTVLGLAATAATAGDEPARPSDGAIRGRTVDEGGKPVAGSRVRLYRRESQEDRRNAVVEEATSGPDGTFRLATRAKPTPPPAREFPHLVLVADHPGLAVGWRTIPGDSAGFAGDVPLTPAAEPRTIDVTDAEGHPLAGATVCAYGIGDLSSTLPRFREYLSLRAGEPPLSAVTDAGGHARFEGLPRTKVSFVATKPGFAETFTFDGQKPIRLTPSATLAGTVTGPDGSPVAGTTVVLHAEFMLDIRHAKTDAQGRYRFEDLAANGWDMSAWNPEKTGNGAYKLWIEDDRLAVHETPVTLEPRAEATADLKAVTACVIRLTLTEAGTNAPVAGARVWGLSTGGRLNALTDAQGRATFRTTPGRANLSIRSPPPGTYFEGEIYNDPEASKAFEVGVGAMDVTLTMPRARRVLDVAGVGTMPDGSPAAGAVVWVSSGKAKVAGGRAYGRPHKLDAAGRFSLEGVASGTMLNLFVQTEDGRLAGTASVRTPEAPDPAFRIAVRLRPTHAALHAIADTQGRPLALEDCTVTPRVGDDDMIWLRRSIKSDEAGMVRVEDALPGLSYRFQVYHAANAEAKAGRGPFFQIHESVTVLIPEKPE